jgi:hypothetical protein
MTPVVRDAPTILRILLVVAGIGIVFAALAKPSAPAPVSAPNNAPYEAPVTVSGEGIMDSAPFALSGGDYMVTWTATAERSCHHGLRLVGAGYSEHIISVSVDGTEDGLAALYDVPTGRYHISASSGCEWTVQFTAQT